MKNFILIFCFLGISRISLAQWTTSGSNIYNNNAGNVGIGISTPATTLDIVTDGNAGNIRNTTYRNAGGQSSFISRFARGTRSLPQIVWNGDVISAIEADTYNGVDFSLQTTIVYSKVNGTVSPTSIPTDIIFGTDSSGQAWSSGSERMRITSLGNLLIGKTAQGNTAYKLDVAGIVRADEIKVNTTGADFVFAEDYQLPSLAETEEFIKHNKHLPEIAPATEMVKNGISLGEMNSKLLQKIEELTLHLIEKDKVLTDVLGRLKKLEDNK